MATVWCSPRVARFLSLPFEPGRLVELPRNEGVRYRNATFLPDGKTLLPQSDASGEIEFCTAPPTAPKPRSRSPATASASALAASPRPTVDGSPGGQGHEAVGLWLRQEGRPSSSPPPPATPSAPTSPGRPIRNGSPSARKPPTPTSNQNLPRDGSQDRDHHDPTARTATAPRGRLDGKWLYFLSDLRAAQWWWRAPGPAAARAFDTDTVKIYHLALKKGERSPFRPADELSATSTPSTSPTKSITTTSTSSLSSSTVNRLESLIRPMVERMLEEKGTEKPRNDGQTKTGTSKTPAKPEAQKPSAPSVSSSTGRPRDRSWKRCRVPPGELRRPDRGQQALDSTSKPAGLRYQEGAQALRDHLASRTPPPPWSSPGNRQLMELGPQGQQDDREKVMPSTPSTPTATPLPTSATAPRPQAAASPSTRARSGSSRCRDPGA